MPSCLFRTSLQAFLIFASIVWSLGANAAPDGRPRIALLIGNQSYEPEIGRLNNPANDVTVLDRALQQIGFEVTVVTDAGYAAMGQAISAHARRLRDAGPGAIGFFYFSGHGAQNELTGRNYLFPVDVKSTQDDTLWDSAFRLEALTADLKETAPEAAHFVVFDACRNQLRLRRAGTKSLMQNKGFKPIADISGMLVAYSTAAGLTASDAGLGAGPYAKALAEEIVKSGVEAVPMFRIVQLKVRAAIGQEPWMSHSALGEVYFAGRELPLAAAGAARADPLAEEIEFWRSIRNTRNPAELKAYIERYPNGVYAGLARERVAALAKAQRFSSGSAFLRLVPEAIVPERDNQPVTAVTPSEPEPCDWQAASPFDRERLAPGLTLAEMKEDLDGAGSGRTGKMPGCRAAMLQHGLQPRLKYQSARVLMVQQTGVQNTTRPVWPWEGSPPAEAMTLLREAAEDGYTAAMIDLGLMAFLGVGSEKNQIQGLDWLQRAAGKGDGLAMALLGVVYAGGFGVPQDQELALSWARTALDYGVAGQLVWLDGLRWDARRGDKWLRSIKARFACLVPEQIISRFGTAKGGPDLVLGLAYPLLVADAAPSNYWLQRSAAAGNTAAVVQLEAANKHTSREDRLLLLRTAMDAGEPVSRGLLGIAAAQGDGMARDEKWARGLIQDFLDSGFLSEVSKGIVEVLTADMRNAGFSQAEIEMHRKVLLQAMDGIAPLPGDAGVITTLLNRPASPPAIEEPLEAFAAAGNVNAMLALAFEYFDRHHKGPGELAEETRLKDWKAMRASLEARSGPLPVDVLAVLTPEEKRDYDQLASVTKPRDALALDRITSSIEASLRKEHAKSVEANRKRIAEWIGRGAEHGNRIAIALDAIIQAQGYAGPANRDAATARGRQLAARGLFDLTETVLEYTASLAAAQPAPSETLVELTRAERTTVRDILRRFFGGIRARNDLVSPILALIALTGGGDPIQGESGAYDWLLTASRKEGNALAGVVLALRLMSTAGPAGAVQSANHFQLAAEQGEPLAQLALGIMYARGLGVARDEYFARRWVGMALGQGKLGEDIRKLVPIVSRVATAAPHLIGFSVPERRVFDALAAEKGQTEALIAFAVLVPDRNADAKDWLRKAADAGNESAKALLADSELSAALAAHHP